MPAYTYTTNNLVRDAYKLISVIDIYDTLQDAQQQQAIELLNEILSVDENDAAVPYFQVISFQAVANQSVYQFSNEMGADVTTNPITLVRNIQYLLDSQTRVPISPRNQDQFKNVMKYQLSVGQPQEYYFYREQNQSFIEFWPKPNSNWTIEVAAKIMFDVQVKNGTLSSIPSSFYRYLKYSLAKELATSYNDAIWTERHESTYEALFNQVRAAAEQDYTIQPSPALNSPMLYPIANNLILP